MIKAAVLGATGYAGIELVRLLTNHPDVSIEILGSQSFDGKKISEVYQNFEGILDKELLALACALEQKSEHPLAKAILEKALEEQVQAEEVTEFAALPGNGLTSKWQGMELTGGNLTFISTKCEVDEHTRTRAEKLALIQSKEKR